MRKYHTHCIFKERQATGKRHRHLLSMRHRQFTTSIRHKREKQFYKEFGKHNYNF